MNKAPFKPIAFPTPSVDAERRPDGSILLRGPALKQDFPGSLGAVLERQALAIPDRVFLAERRPDGSWRRITYRETLASVRALAQALLDRGAGAERPVALLSGNSIDHALLTFAAMHAGVPAAPVSVAYSLMSQDHAKLAHVVRSTTPSVLFAENGAPFAAGIDSLRKAGLLEGVRIVSSVDPLPGGEFLSKLAGTTPTADVDRALAAVTPDTVAKVLFTSGSTGLPKGVINTQRMLCSNQQAVLQTYPFFATTPPVLLDWLPWNHTFGGNFVLNQVLWNGGTLHIDDGRPMPGLIEKTLANLREVSPTAYYNVPRGYDVMLPFIESDDDAARALLQRTEFLFYGGSALPETLWHRLEAVSSRVMGHRVTMTAAWGSTETAPLATALSWQADGPGNIGLPVPGTELLLTPNGAKKEMRVRGPNVTPGYWRRPDLTEAAFDAEGFYRIGDAGRLADEAAPVKGVFFDGRVAEDFKLTTGTWVHAGGLRVSSIAAVSPVAQDCVVAGHDRDFVALLIFPSPAGCLSLCPGAKPDTPIAELLLQPTVRRRIAEGLAAHNAANPGSSTRIARALLLAAAPSIDANEITDKGYINQRAVLDHRARDVVRLYAEPPDDEVIVIGR
jgi:feruloyl-CoA synthase